MTPGTFVVFFVPTVIFCMIVIFENIHWMWRGKYHEPPPPTPVLDPHNTDPPEPLPPVSHPAVLSSPSSSPSQMRSTSGSEVSRGDLEWGIQRGGVPESSQMGMAQMRKEHEQFLHFPTPQHHPTSALHNYDNTVPPRLDTVSEQSEIPGSPTSSDGLPLVGMIEPYTYQIGPPTAAASTRVGLESGVQLPVMPQAGQASVHIPSHPGAPSLDPPYTLPTPAEFDEIDGNSFTPQSEVSIEDSLLPPEYQSTWGSE